MVDSFVVLTPVLVLMIIALFRFIGCATIMDVSEPTLISIAITTTSPLPPAMVGIHYGTSLAAQSGTPPYTWSVVGGALPPGLTMDATGIISGIPTAGGVYSVSIRVTESTGLVSTQAPFTINVGTIPSGVAPTVTFVQANSGPTTVQTSNSSVAVPYTSTQTAGNLNIVVVGWQDTTSALKSVTDTQGNAYKLAVGPTSGTGLQQAIYYATNKTTGSNTVTVTFNRAAAFPDVRILEYSDLNTLDAVVAAAGTGTLANSGSAVTTQANELIFGAGISGSAFATAYEGTGFNGRIRNVFGNIAEDKTVSSAGSYSAVATNSSSSWVMQMASFFKS